MDRSVETMVWTDEKLESLSFVQKALFLYLITNERSHFCGLYRLPMSAVEEGTGLPAEEIAETFSLLQKIGRIIYDNDNKVIWIKNMEKRQSGRGGRPDFVLRGIFKQLREVDSPLAAMFLEYYPDVTDRLRSDGYLARLGKLNNMNPDRSIPTVQSNHSHDMVPGNGSAEPPGTGTGTGTVNAGHINITRAEIDMNNGSGAMVGSEPLDTTKGEQGNGPTTINPSRKWDRDVALQHLGDFTSNPSHQLVARFIRARGILRGVKTEQQFRGMVNSELSAADEILTLGHDDAVIDAAMKQMNEDPFWSKKTGGWHLVHLPQVLQEVAAGNGGNGGEHKETYKERMARMNADIKRVTTPSVFDQASYDRRHKQTPEQYREEVAKIQAAEFAAKEAKGAGR